MGIEREIRFRVTQGEPPLGGQHFVQAYLMRRPAFRVRLIDDRAAHLNLKVARATGDFEWEFGFPASLARWLLRLPWPRVVKTRRVEGELEVDRYSWPPDLVVVECELASGEGPDLRDAQARAAWMEARRPEWVAAWHDVTEDRSLRAASLAKRMPPGAAKPDPAAQRRSTR